MRLYAFIIAMLLSGLTAKAQSSELSIEQTTKLIQAARKSAVDPRGWAIDLLDVLRSQNQPPSRENVCSAIAIIDQESNFVADPAVAGLGVLAEKTLRAKAVRIPSWAAWPCSFWKLHLPPMTAIWSAFAPPAPSAI